MSVKEVNADFNRSIGSWQDLKNQIPLQKDEIQTQKDLVQENYQKLSWLDKKLSILPELVSTSISSNPDRIHTYNSSFYKLNCLKLGLSKLRTQRDNRLNKIFKDVEITRLSKEFSPLRVCADKLRDLAKNAKRVQGEASWAISVEQMDGATDDLDEEGGGGYYHRQSRSANFSVASSIRELGNAAQSYNTWLSEFDQTDNDALVRDFKIEHSCITPLSNAASDIENQDCCEDCFSSLFGRTGDRIGSQLTLHSLTSAQVHVRELESQCKLIRSQIATYFCTRLQGELDQINPDFSSDVRDEIRPYYDSYFRAG